MTPAELIVAIVGPAGIMAVLPYAIKEYKAWRSGRADAEKRANRSALGRLVEETERADNEASYRRIMQEYASGLRRLLIDWGYPEDKLPAWPTRESKEIA